MSLMAFSSSGGAASDRLYVDDVFSAYIYTGNGSSQTINNGIDLAGKGGVVWIKSRGPNAYNHNLTDTVRGATKSLFTSTSGAESVSSTFLTAFNANGFDISTHATVNFGTDIYASWTFRKAKKFFDVVTYTGDGVAGRQITHNLGIAPGMIIVKATSTTSEWAVYHRGSGGINGISSLSLNTTQAAGATTLNTSIHTSSTFYIPYVRDANGNAEPNVNGVQYVAYLFAHDPSADGIIQCGSFSGNTTTTLGWEPQYILYKRTDSTGNWIVVDSMRGIPTGTSDQELYPNLANAETTSSSDYITLNATGFTTTNLTGTFVYMAIRRPNKPPTSGTQVYNAIARTGTGAAATVTGVGFAPDLVIASARTSEYAKNFIDRLRGRAVIACTSTAAEVTPVAGGDLLSWDMDGISVGTQASTPINAAVSTIGHYFRRAPGFFDVVCYTGTGVATSVPHGLGVIPELMIVKGRIPVNASGTVFVEGFTINQWLTLELPKAKSDSSVNKRFNSLPTATSFEVSSSGSVSYIGGTFVAYLFASLSGISRVGSYTGNGSSQTINCGFSTGARFILIKRTASTGDWYIWDSARGIVAANDPHLSLNTKAEEVTTDDSVDPDNSGFIVNQVAATNINVTSANYIFLAIA